MSAHQQEPEQPNRPYSIDLSLELERQLDNESRPSTPPPAERPASLDQVVLTSIVQQLQKDVGVVTKERDTLKAELSKAESDKQGLQAILDQISTKYEKMEEELEKAKTKMLDDEHAISMLRTKVEESRYVPFRALTPTASDRYHRRGLMRLQTETRRMSQVSMPIDTSRVGVPALNFGGPSSNKRASFTPLTGSGAARMNGHKRISSVSDTGFLLSNTSSPDNLLIPSPNAQTVHMSDLQSSAPSHPPVSSNRFSGLFGRTSPPQSLDIPPQDSLVEELEALRREVKTIKSELEDTRHELLEANESREASEACAKALRDFIGETKSVKLPPMPTMTTGEEADTKKSASGWGAFRMWKMDPVVKAEGSNSGSAPPSSVGTRRLWQIDTAAKGSPNGSASSSPMTSAAPFAAKVGNFFGSRASISSIASSALPAPRPPLREPSYTGSDASSMEESVAEPISPVAEIPGATVMVCGTSDSSTDVSLPEPMKTLQKADTAVESISPLPQS
jgi:hypothetical protein